MDKSYWNRAPRRRFLQGSAGVVASSWLAFAAACSGKSTSNNTTNGQAKPSQGGANVSGATPTPQGAVNVSGGTPKSGGRLREINGEPDQYDPHRDAGYPGLLTMSAVYSALLRTRLDIDKDYKVEGDLVKGVPEQPDSTTFIFKINDGAKWHNVAPTNGRAVVAEDIKRNFERMVTPKPDFVLRPMFEMIDSVQTPDNQTAVVKLKFQYGQFVVNCADVWAKVIPSELYNGDDAKLKPVGSGPFIFKDAKPNVGQTLDKNPDYFRKGQPYLDGIDFIVFDPANPALGAAAFQGGKLDTIIDFATIAIMQQLEKDYPKGRYAERFSVMNPMMINNDRPPFNDERVRQALYYALDPQLITQLSFKGLAQSGQPIPVWLTRYNLPANNLPNRDVQKAKQLLAAAGYKDGFKFTNRTFQGGVQAFGTLQVQQALKDAGADMANQEMDWADWRLNVYGAKGDFEITLGGEFDYLSPDRQLYNAFSSQGSANNRHVKDPMLDQLLLAARQELDPQRQIVRYKEASKYLVDHAISVWLPQSKNIVGTQPWVNGWFWMWSQGALFERNFMDEVWLNR